MKQLTFTQFSDLIPIQDVADRIHKFKEGCYPDVKSVKDAEFCGRPEKEVFGESAGRKHKSTIYLSLPQLDDKPFIFTDWSWPQTKQLFGIKQRWIDTAIDYDHAAKELNDRIGVVLSDAMIRSMNPEDSSVNVIRGVVSNTYKDIPDTDIIDTLVNAMPDAKCVRILSAKTARACYIATIAEEKPIKLSSDSPTLRPGIIFKNSEVGFTSLWAHPALYTDKGGILSFTGLESFRRVHRGSNLDLHKDFKEAVDKVQKVWADLPAQMRTLKRVTYQDETHATESMYDLITSLRGTKQFAYDCTNQYKKIQGPHDGVRVLNSMIQTIEADRLHADTAHQNGGLAGAALLKLLSL